MAKTYNLKTAPKKFIDKVVNVTEGKQGGAVLLNAFFKIEQKKRESYIKQNTPTETKTKSKPVKYASIGIKQMRMGRSGTILTSGGLLSNNKTTIKKKSLLGQ